MDDSDVMDWSFDASIMDWKFDTPRSPIFQQPYTLSELRRTAPKRPFGVFSDGTEPTDRHYDQWALSSDDMELTESHPDQWAQPMVDRDSINRQHYAPAQEPNRASGTELTDHQWPLPPINWDAVRRKSHAAARETNHANGTDPTDRNNLVPVHPINIVEEYAAVREVYHPDLPRPWYDRVIRGLQWTAFTIYAVGAITTVAAVRASQLGFRGTRGVGRFAARQPPVQRAMTAVVDVANTHKRRLVTYLAGPEPPSTPRRRPRYRVPGAFPSSPSRNMRQPPSAGDTFVRELQDRTTPARPLWADVPLNTVATVPQSTESAPTEPESTPQSDAETVVNATVVGPQASNATLINEPTATVAVLAEPETKPMPQEPRTIHSAAVESRKAGCKRVSRLRRHFMPNSMINSERTPSPTSELLSQKLDQLELSGRLEFARERKESEVRVEQERKNVGSRAEEERTEREEKEKRDGIRHFPKNKLIEPLSEEWDRKISDVLRKNLRTAVGKTSTDLDITRKDIGTVLPQHGIDNPSGWLNDEIIGAYLQVTVDHGHDQLGQRPRLRTDVPKYHAFSSFFYDNLKNKGYDSVKRWAKKAKFEGKSMLQLEYIFIPINHGGTHWTLAVVSPVRKTIEYFDSMHGESGAVITNIKKWLKGELKNDYNESDWRLLEDPPYEGQGKGPTQNNAKDCGVFTATTAKMIILGVDPTAITAADMPIQRKRLVAEVINGGFTGVFEPRLDY